MNEQQNEPRVTASGLVARIAAVWRAQWWRAAIVLLALSLAAVAITVTALALSPSIHEVQNDLVAGRGRDSLDRLLAAVTLLGLPAIGILLLLLSAAFGTAAIMAEAARAGGPVRLGSALVTGIRRSPIVLAASALAVLAVAGLVIAAPTVMIVGLLWLAAVPLLLLAARRWPRMATIASWRRALLLAIPFGPAVYLALQWSLALPAAALGDRGPLRALEASRLAVDGHRGRVAAILAGTLAAFVALQWALGALLSPWAGSGVATSVQGIIQLVLGSLPVVAATVLLGGRERGARRPRRERRLAPRVATAVAVAACLTATLLVPGAAPAVAAEQPLTTTTTLSISPSPSPAGTSFDIHVLVTASDGSHPEGGSLIIRGDSPDFPILERGIGAGGVVAITGNVSLGMLAAGDYLVSAEFMGWTSDDGTFYDRSRGEASHTVTEPAGGPATTTLTASGVETPSRPGDERTITFTVTPAPPLGGTIDATIGSQVFTGLGLNDGQATLSLGNLAIGDHAITASFAGGPSLKASSYSGVHTVARAAASMTLTVDPSPSRLGSSPHVIARVEADSPALTVAPTGTVTFGYGTETSGPIAMIDGAASFSPPLLELGPITLTATYDGDANYDGSSASVAHSVIAKSTTGVEIATDSEFVVGRASTIRIAVEGDAPSGNVYARILDADDHTADARAIYLAAGEASYQFAPQAPGRYRVTVEYEGDSENIAGSATLEIEAVKAASTATLGAPAASEHGSAVTLTATIASAEAGGPAPSGTVTFTAGGRELSAAAVAGQASVTTSLLPVGTTTVTASYGGDGNYLASEALPITHTVSLASTTTSIAVSGSGIAGEAATITVTVASGVSGGSTPAGSITLSFGSFSQLVSLVDGVASLTTASLPPGAAAITASYPGSAGHAPSSTTATHTVRLATTNTTVSLDPASAVTGQTVIATVSVGSQAPAARVPTGIAYILRSGSVIASGDLDETGVAEIAIRVDAGVGSDPLRIEYSGDSSATGSVASVAFTVSKAATAVALGTDASEPRLGDPITLTATVAGAAPSTGTARSGTVTFYRGSSVIATAPLAADGTASHELPATWLGTQEVSARFSGSADYLAGSSAAVPLTVGKYIPTIALEVSPASITWGGLITVRATVGVPAGGFDLAGQLTIYDGGTAIAVHQLNGASQLSWSTTVPAAELGAHDFSAVLVSQSTAHDGASSPVVTRHVGGLATTILFGQGTSGPVMPERVFALNVVPPGWTSAQPYPSGRVELRTSGGQLLGSSEVAPLAGGTALGEITVAAAALGVGTHALVASFIPDGDSRHAGSVLDINYTVTPLTTLALLSASPQIVRAGDTVTASVSLEAAPSAPFSPTGTITVADGSGQSCTVAAPGGSCTLTLTAVGTQSLSASYSGDAHFSAATATPATVIVGTAVATASVTVSTSTPVTGDPVTVSWQIAGPTSGSVTHGERLAAAGCPTTLAGSCTITFDRARGLEFLTVSFAGDERWSPVSASAAVTPIGCYPLSLSAVPAEAGTLAPLTAPNCGNGTRYLTGTAVTVVATTSAASAAREWKLEGIGLATSGSPSGVIVISDTGPNGAAAFFTPVYHCVTVTIAAQQATPGLGKIAPTVQPNCPLDSQGVRAADWKLSSGSYTGRFLVGSTVTTTATVLDRTGEIEVYGYRWNGAAVSQRSANTFAVQADTTVTAVFGPRCYRVDTRAEGPGSIYLGTAPNCSDPRNSWAGWSSGTPVTMVAVPHDFTTGVVTGWSGADSAGEPAARNVRFESTTGPLQTGPASSLNTVTIGFPGQHRVISASFNRCHRVTLATGIMPQNSSGTVAFATPANCSLYPGDSGWFLEGTQLTVRATPGPEVIKNMRNPLTGALLPNARIETQLSVWRLNRSTATQHSSDDTSARPDKDLTVTVDGPLSIRAEFATLLYDNKRYPILTGTECFALTVRSASSQLEVSSTPGRGVTSCSMGTLNGVFGPAASGAFPIRLDDELHNFTIATRATSGDPLLGWTIEASDATKPWRRPLTSHAVGNELSYYQAPGDITATAVACQTIEPAVALTNSLGQQEVSPAPEGSYFVMASPAPNCPYANYAWTVGTEIEVAALADPAGYTFTGWGGAASGSALATKVRLDGSSPSLPVTASYDVTCKKLTLTHDAKDVTASPQPNCPGYAPSDSMYATGTVVALTGRVPSGKKWIGWVGDIVRTPTAASSPAIAANPFTAAPQAGNLAVFEKIVYVVMDADKSAGHRWRSKDPGEQLSDGFSSTMGHVGDFFVDISDELAITAKKMVAVMALLVEEAAAYLPPLGVIQLLAGASALVGTVLEAAGVSTDTTKWLKAAQEFSDWMLSTISCAAVWGFNGNGNEQDNLFAASPAKKDENALIGAGKDAASLADRIASGELKSEESIRAAASEALSTYETVTGARDTVVDTVGLVSEARAAYFRTASNAARVADDVIPSGFGVGAVLAGAGIVLGGGFGIDSSATEAWTDGSAYVDCLADRMPSFIGGQE